LAEALRHYRFWVLAIAFLGSSGAYVGVVANLIPMVMARGSDAFEAVGLLSMFAIAILVGRLVTGVLIDRIWAPFVCSMLCGVASVALLSWSMVTPRAAVVQVALVGVASGSEYDLSSYLAARYFGRRAYGRIYSCIYASFAVGGVIASQFYGWSFEHSGSYATGIFASAAGFGLCAVLPLTLGRYPTDHDHRTLWRDGRVIERAGGVR
jgi:fucose permease